ncbi:MAG TPA: hypothetical protein VK169_08780 [Saprospiraceae bacterium]|nr:hypothetical protein [Saprospiraceae bacterium]
MSNSKIPPIVKIGAYFLSFCAFIVGFWHAHLGLKNQHFFGSEYGSLVIAGMILVFILISYYLAVSGRKVAVFFYLIGAFTLIIYNLNYFYPYDFKEDLVKEDAGILKDTIQVYTSRAASITSIKSEAEKDYRNLEQLKEQIYSEIKNQGGTERIARGKIADFNAITRKYGIQEVKPSLISVKSHEEQANLVDAELKSALQNFIVINNSEGVTDAKAKIELEVQLKQLQSKYTPVLEYILIDTTKIDISNDKKNIENNPKNIAQIAKIISEINSVTKSVNEIYRTKGEKEPFSTLEASITELGSIGHTLPSIKQHSVNGTKEQKVGTWKNILLVIFLDLIVPLAIYVLIRRKEEEDDGENFFYNLFRKSKNFNKQTF